MSVTVVKGTLVAGTTGTYTPAWPASAGAWAAGDWGVVIVGSHPETASTIASFGTGGGTKSNASSNGAAQGAGTGDTVITMRWAVLAGTEGGTTVTVTDSDDSVTWAQCYVLHSDVGWTSNVAQAWGTDDTTGTSYSAACGGDAGASYQTGDVLISGTSIPRSNVNAWTSEAFAATGLTFDTIVEQAENTSGSGNNIGGVVTTARVASGSASGGPTVTFSATLASTPALSGYGPTVILGFREGTPNATINAVPAAAVAAVTSSTVSPTSNNTVTALAAAAVAVGALASVTTTSNANVNAVPATAVAAAPQATIATTASVSLTATPATAVAGITNSDILTTSAQDVLVDARPAYAVAAAGRASVDPVQNLTITVVPAVAVTAAGRAIVTTVTDVTVNASPAYAVAAAANATIFAGGAIGYGDTSNRDDGIDLDGTADVIWEPDVAPVPELIGPRLEKDVRVAAQVIDTPPGALPTFTKAVGRRQYAAALRERVLVGDADVSFLRGVPVTVDNIRLIDPLRYGSASITLPQVDPAYSTLGYGDLAWVTDFAPVRVQLVDADDVVIVPDYYKGFITRINTDGPSLSLDLGGQAAGSLSLLQVPNAVYRRKQDVEHILVDLLRDARVRAHEHAGSSGVGLIKRGASDGLTLFNETLAVWAGATDSPITFTPRDSDGAYRKTVKDTTTIHGTVYVDHGLISQSIARDLTTEIRAVYANGFTEAGELVTNIKTPGMTQGVTPAFPLASGSLVVDMTDADTTTGAGITALQEQLALHNWLDIDEATPGVFDDVTGDAVVAFKTQAGTASLTPAVSASAWDLLWNLTRVGYSLDDAREYPMAEDPAVRKWNRTANGSKESENPLYDPHIKPVGEFIDVGGPFKRGEIVAFAQSRLRSEDVWIGTLTFRSGLVAGEHNPGDPFTTADVMDRRELLPNMRLWLPYFQGGKVFYVTGVEHGTDETTASVATKPESTYETWAAIARVREAKSNVARMAQGHVRQSQVRRDIGPSWDTTSGLIANKVALAAGWNEVKVPAGQEGIVGRVDAELQTPDEFALLLTSKPVSVDALNNRIDPLVESRPSQRPWWEREAIVDWLEGRGWLEHWGTPDQPCGYDPSPKTDDHGPTAQAITGRFVEAASANYETGAEPVLYLYIWVGADNHLLPGRILRNQRTADF